MVTLAFYAAGAALDAALLAGAGQAGATVIFGAAQVGAAIGAYIDSRWLGPMLSSDPPTQNFQAQLVQGADDGAPMVRCFGQESRFAGQVIWLGELEHFDRDLNNTKGGTGGNAVEHVYFVTCEVGICQGPIERVLKVWADGKLIYDVTGATVDLSSDEVDLEAWTVIYSIGNATGVRTLRHRARITAPDGGVDLSTVNAGQSVMMSGWSNSKNNKSGKCISSRTNSDGTTEFVVQVDEQQQQTSPGVWPTATLDFVTEPAGATVTVVQGYLAYSNSVATRFTFYPGDETQLPDPYIESIDGSTESTGYRGTARMVIEGLKLLDFGHRLPNFTFLVRESGSRTVGEAIASILAAAGVPESGYDVSACTDSLRGYHTSGHQTAASDIGPLLIANDIMVSERDGVLTFVPRSSITPRDLDAELLAAHDYGSSGDGVPQLVEVNFEPREATISDCIVRYVDPRNDHQPGTQRDVRVTMPRRVVQSIDLATMTMSADEARTLARRSLWMSAANARRVRFTLPPSEWPDINEGDVVTFTAQGRDWTVLVTRIDRAPSMLLEVSGFIEQRHLSSISGAGVESLSLVSGPGSGSQFRSFAPPSMDYVVLDCHALSNEHVTSIGYYVAAACTDPAAEFAGAVVYESLDGARWEPVLTLREEAMVGETLTVLAPTSNADVWDETNGVMVRMFHGTLESVTDEDCLAGRNRMMINGGSEVIGFANAEHQGDNVYYLSRLLRGRNYTEVYATTAPHARETPVVMVNGGGIEWRALNHAAIGQTRYVKVVPSGGLPDDYDSVIMSADGITARPPTVTAVEATRDGSNNLTLTWVRRTRAVSRVLSPGGAPQLEPVEEYRIEVLDAPGGTTVLRTVDVTTTSATYTAAQQTADGFTPGDPIPFRVAQRSDHAFYGDWLELEL